jgi:hypothetical protein
MALGTPRSDRAEARGQQWAAEDAGSVARDQLQTAARSSHTRVSGPLTIVTNTVAVEKPLPASVPR